MWSAGYRCCEAGVVRCYEAERCPRAATMGTPVDPLPDAVDAALVADSGGVGRAGEGDDARPPHRLGLLFGRPADDDAARSAAVHGQRLALQGQRSAEMLRCATEECSREECRCPNASDRRAAPCWSRTTLGLFRLRCLASKFRSSPGPSVAMRMYPDLGGADDEPAGGRQGLDSTR